MKLFLFLMLFSFSAHAQSAGSGGSSVTEIISRIAPSVFAGFTNPNQVYSPVSPYCVEDNFEKCQELGYTQTSCTSGGVACPYDPSLLSCSLWSCEELGLFASKPDYMECEKVQLPTIACYKCQCGAGFVNYEDCDGLIQILSGDETICEGLGYTDSVTDCANYLVCPANGNKVRCLDVVGCHETLCIAQTEVPANADPIYTSRNCSCKDGHGNTLSKEVITGWTCKSGYKKEGNTCVAEICKSGEFEGPDATDPTAGSYKIDECYTIAGGNTAPGWTKVATENKSGKQCYKCECILPSNCIYSASNKQEFGKLEDLCCDNEHYVGCVRDCPTDKHVPDIGAVADKSWCKACGEQTEYISGWHCKDGYIVSNAGTACDPRPCPQDGNGKYYSLAYEKVEDCNSLIRAGAGWQYTAEPAGAKHGEGYCHLCECPYGENDNVYKYSVLDTSNVSDSNFSDLGCNGKYKYCVNLKTDDPLYFLPGQVPAHADFNKGVQSLKICGEQYYRVISCEQGYEYIERECLPRDCTGYNIEGECPEWGDCSRCVSAGSFKYKLDSCRNDANIRYKPNSAGTECCQATCDENDSSYFVGTCPQGKTLVDTKLNGCGETCVKCL